MLREVVPGKQNRIAVVEREVALSAASYDKGVHILAGYLNHAFALDRAASFTARLVFEQSYGGISGDSATAESKLKALTGGDKITARFMRQDFFEFTPSFKLLIAGNHKPGLRSVDEAIRRRIRTIWPDLHGLSVLGVGYATPFLRQYRDEAERVLAIMFRPGDTWTVIAAEFTTAGSVYKSHVLPLAVEHLSDMLEHSVLRPADFEAERQVIGNPHPDFTGGLTNRVSWRNFSLDGTVQFVWGQDRFSGGAIFFENNQQWFDPVMTTQLRRWQNPGDVTDVPQFRLFQTNGTQISSRYLYDASFVRLRSVSVGYDIPAHLTGRLFGDIENIAWSVYMKGWEVRDRAAEPLDVLDGVAPFSAERVRGRLAESERHDVAAAARLGITAGRLSRLSAMDPMGSFGLLPGV